ncbi:MAG: hypothetical protein RBR45_10305 [Pseudomonas sp.]|jgi:hypothetical protein|nr:hypothetical protein [Pseudomonas sp.]
MQVIAASHISGCASTTDKQLKILLKTWLKQSPRRIDRFILQSLLAAVAIQQHVRADCGLYVASAYPARTTMASLLNSVCAEQRQPKPFEFVNSVSNAAGFHIAQQLKLNGPNLFISANAQVWQQLSMLAACDLKSGSIQQALLVFCDEEEDFNAQAVLLEDSPTEQAATIDFQSLCSAIDICTYHFSAADSAE